MPYKAIVSDWNGTLFEYATDEAQNKKIAYAILGEAKKGLLKGKVWKVGTIFNLLKAKKELKKRLQEYKEGKLPLAEVYEPFNDRVLEGKPAEFIEGVINDYARENAEKVDHKVLRPIKAAHSAGKSTAILSVSYYYSIRRILAEVGYWDTFDTIVANHLKTVDCKAVGLSLDIYDRKPEVLREKLLAPAEIKESEVLYFGDSDDDAKVAEMLPHGSFIVPFFATEDFKQKMSSKHSVFVPENEADLDRYLKTR